MNKFFVALVGLTAAIVPMSLADHCEEPFLDRDTEELRISDPETGAVLYYVDNDPCQPDCGFSIWIYEESNGFSNLQRQDATGEDVDEYTQDDTCHGMIKPDTIIF